MVIDDPAPALSNGAEQFLQTLRDHGMHNECVAAARRAPLTVRVTWAAADGASGSVDCIAFSTLDAIKMHRARMPGATINAQVLRWGRR